MSDSEATVIADYVAHVPNIRRIFDLCESSDSETETLCCLIVNNENNEKKKKKKKRINYDEFKTGRKRKYDEIIEDDDNEQNNIENQDNNEQDHSQNQDPNEQPRSRRPKRKYKFNKNRNIEDPNEYSDQDFRDVFRMSRSCFDLLLDIVANKFPRLGLSPNKKSLPPRKRLLMFLLVAGSDMAGAYRKHNFQLSHGCITDNMTVCIEVLYDGKNDDYKHVFYKQFDIIFLLFQS